MRVTAAVGLITALALSPGLAQTPNPKLKNPPPPRPPAPATEQPVGEAKPAEAGEKSSLELLQQRRAEQEARAIRSICSNCGRR